MPVAVLDAVDGGLKARAANGGVADPACCEIEPDTADARLIHGVEVAVRGLAVDTATPRAVAPRALMPNNVAELSGP